ncbi:hypothetical protein OC25_17580 [Pedobacter kyungheensis]|uniref:Uncharacterized protein n=1 Tax=Pedobacter kyungheensis TaxID=1069985 RepID=A0A0C1FKB6_9SPHI|nr:hypothetical protein [Pedobacter kyungheensis]KIA92248.1 hypothetical protein OC25_17580 [Pedobacter kyungheensis]
MRFSGKREKELENGQVRFAEKVAAGILGAQRRLADYLNRRTAGFSARRWRTLLLGFCLLFGSYTLYLLIAAIY